MEFLETLQGRCSTMDISEITRLSREILSIAKELVNLMRMKPNRIPIIKHPEKVLFLYPKPLTHSRAKNGLTIRVAAIPGFSLYKKAKKSRWKYAGRKKILRRGEIRKQDDRSRWERAKGRGLNRTRKHRPSYPKRINSEKKTSAWKLSLKQWKSNLSPMKKWAKSYC